jgi:hypothetical protein
MKKTYKITGKVWMYSGFAGWHFVYIDDKSSKDIKNKYKPFGKKGFGSIKVLARIGKSEWYTSIFPTKEGPYLLAIKSAIRKKEAVYDGDNIKFSISIV